MQVSPGTMMTVYVLIKKYSRLCSENVYTYVKINSIIVLVPDFNYFLNYSVQFKLIDIGFSV